MAAFCVDYILIGIIIAIAGAVVFVLGLVTLGLGWILYIGLVPLVAVIYFGYTIGGPDHASPGMKMFSIRLETLDGKRIDFVLAAVHTVLFWAGNAIVSPLILAASFFSKRKRLLHDLLLGTVIVRSDG